MKRYVLITVCVLLALSLPASASAGPAANEPGVSLLRADEHAIVLQVRTPNYALEKLAVGGADCQRIQATGAVQSEQPGHPQLPVQIALLGVPPDAELAVEVTPLQTTRLPGSHAICPAPKAVAKEEQDGLVRYVTVEQAPDSAVYGQDQLYPAEIATVEDLGFMRSQRIVRLAVFPFQIAPLSGELRYHQRLQVVLRVKGDVGARAAVIESPEFETALKSALLNYESARAWRGSPGQSADTGWTPPQPGYKIMVKEKGIYELSYAALAAAGLPVDTLDPRTLRLFSAGEEVAISVSGEGDGHFDEGDGVLFYGQGVDTRYTDTNVYWLTYGGADGLRMTERPSQPGGDRANSFETSAYLEDNLIYISSLPMLADANHWYGARIQAAGTGNAGWLDYEFTAQHMVTEPFTATLAISLAGNYNGVHHLRLYVNGNQVHDDKWGGRSVYETNVAFSHSYLNEGSNTLRVELANDTPGQTLDMAYMDWVRVDYQRSYVAENDVLAFGGDQSGAWQYQVSGFSGQDVELYDVTDATRVNRITGAMVSGSPLYFPLIGAGNSSVARMATPAAGGRAMPLSRDARAAAAGRYTLQFGDSQDSARRYLAQTSSRRLTPLNIELDNPSSLQSETTGADYIIIAYRDFIDAVQPLAAHRAAQGLRTRVVDVQDIYDEFGYGLMSAEAIHDFLAYAYSAWPGVAPSNVLLVGDGTYDFRHYLLNSADTYIPPYLDFVDPELGETATENRFTNVVGDDILPDLAIGRLPANSADDVTVMVNKILNYENNPGPKGWNRNIIFVTDDLDGGGGNFYTLSDGIADGYADPPTNTIKYLPQPYVATKVYLGQTCPDQEPSIACKQQIVDTLNNNGALLMSYIGHATKSYWARERVMDFNGLFALNNGDRLPIALPMTCLEGFFHEAQIGTLSFGEANLRLPNAGAVASWSPSGLGVATGHDLLEQGLFLALFRDGVHELGAATNQAKLYLLANAPPGRYKDLVDTYLILGDPALWVQLLEGQ